MKSYFSSQISSLALLSLILRLSSHASPLLSSPSPLSDLSKSILEKTNQIKLDDQVLTSSISHDHHHPNLNLKSDQQLMKSKVEDQNPSTSQILHPPPHDSDLIQPGPEESRRWAEVEYDQSYDQVILSTLNSFLPDLSLHPLEHHHSSALLIWWFTAAGSMKRFENVEKLFPGMAQSLFTYTQPYLHGDDLIDGSPVFYHDLKQIMSNYLQGLSYQLPLHWNQIIDGLADELQKGTLNGLYDLPTQIPDLVRQAGSELSTRYASKNLDLTLDSNPHTKPIPEILMARSTMSILNTILDHQDQSLYQFWNSWKLTLSGIQHLGANPQEFQTQIETLIQSGEFINFNHHFPQLVKPDPTLSSDHHPQGDLTLPSQSSNPSTSSTHPFHDLQTLQHHPSRFSHLDQSSPQFHESIFEKNDPMDVWADAWAFSKATLASPNLKHIGQASQYWLSASLESRTRIGLLAYAEPLMISLRQSLQSLDPQSHLPSPPPELFQNPFPDQTSAIIRNSLGYHFDHLQIPDFKRQILLDQINSDLVYDQFVINQVPFLTINTLHQIINEARSEWVPSQSTTQRFLKSFKTRPDLPKSYQHALQFGFPYPNHQESIRLETELINYLESIDSIANQVIDPQTGPFWSQLVLDLQDPSIFHHTFFNHPTTTNDNSLLPNLLNKLEALSSKRIKIFNSQIQSRQKLSSSSWECLTWVQIGFKSVCQRFKPQPNPN